MDIGEEFDINEDGENPVIYFYTCSEDGCNDGSSPCNGEDIAEYYDNDNNDNDGDGNTATHVQAAPAIVMALLVVALVKF